MCLFYLTKKNTKKHLRQKWDFELLNLIGRCQKKGLGDQQEISSLDGSGDHQAPSLLWQQHLSQSSENFCFTIQGPEWSVRIVVHLFINTLKPCLKSCFIMLQMMKYVKLPILDLEVETCTPALSSNLSCERASRHLTSSQQNASSLRAGFNMGFGRDRS